MSDNAPGGKPPPAPKKPAARAPARRKPGEEPAPPADSFERLIREMEKLPGIGRRSAERMAYHLLGVPAAEAMALAIAIRDVKRNLRPCAVCGDLTEQMQCRICEDNRRDASVVCVVEWPRDLRSIEKSGQFRGRYHVLMGRLSPLNGVAPADLRIAPLHERLKAGGIRELVLALSPSVEGDATAALIAQQARDGQSGVRVTRLARGLPEGSDLAFAQSGTLGEAFRGRMDVSPTGPVGAQGTVQH